MKKTIKTLSSLALIATLTSCMTFNRSMREPETLVNLTKSDFSLSNQVTAMATSTKIICIDFPRLFTKKTGVINKGYDANINFASIPVIGNFLVDRTANYSLFNLMQANPGYDVVFYPQYETKVLKPILGIGFLTKITTVKTTARLGKLNK